MFISCSDVTSCAQIQLIVALLTGRSDFLLTGVSSVYMQAPGLGQAVPSFQDFRKIREKIQRKHEVRGLELLQKNFLSSRRAPSGDIGNAL